MIHKTKITAGLILVACGISIGFPIGRWAYRPKPAPPAEYKPESIQKDGSRIVESKPQPKYKPDAMVPKGAKVERVVTVSVVPVTRDNVARLELVQVRLPDASTRVIAKSDGHILEAVDIPVATGPNTPEWKWAAGASYRMPSRTWGAWVDRDLGRIRTGAELTQEREPVSGITRLALSVRVGIRW